MIFCDTSTLAKYYAPEADSPAVVAHLDAEDGVALSQWAKAELMGVFHRKVREKQWTQRDFHTVVRQFQQDDAGGYWNWLPLDDEMVTKVCSSYLTMPHDIFLRSADCLHLITALTHGYTDIYTHDHHQAKAAPAFSLNAIAIR